MTVKFRTASCLLNNTSVQCVTLSAHGYTIKIVISKHIIVQKHRYTSALSAVHYLIPYQS